MPQQNPRSPTSTGLVLAVLLALPLLLVGRPASPNDIDLLRFNTAKPYVFIHLDTSASMALAPDNTWVPAGADDPGSKLYQAKQVLYDVFLGVDDIHLGLATMEQRRLAVRAKHWNYRLRGSSSPLSIGYPVPGALWTFGAHFGTNTARDCSDPLDLDTAAGRAVADRFSKLGVDGNGPTYLWLEKLGQVYRLRVHTPNDKLGDSNLGVSLTLERWDADCDEVLATEGPVPASFRLDREFLMADREVGPVGVGEEARAGFWDWEDALDTAVCDNSNKRGNGWETNYDGTFEDPPSFPVAPNTDPFGLCPSRSNPLLCDNLKRPTLESPVGRPLDRGDLLPWEWLVDNKQAFLARLAPNHPSSTPEFGVAPYFEDVPGLSGYLEPRNRMQLPLVAQGVTPLGRMVGDFRCWYQGDENNKCSVDTYNPGWESIAKEEDTEWGCRRQYQIVISDGQDNCLGPNPCSDTANLRAKSGVRTWVIAYGADCENPGNPLGCMASNGDGELVCPQDPENLRTELNRILGIIREEARAFASATAPTAQATAADRIYLSNFVPLNDSGVWDGHLNAFLKPLPVDEVTGRPDTGSERHLWDAAEELRDHQAPTQAQADAGNLRLGTGNDQRRIFYSRLTRPDGTTTPPGDWPFVRRLFDQTDDATAAEVRYDLWKGLGIPYNEDDPDAVPPVDQVAQDRANQVLADTLAIKELTLDDGTPISFVLGDMFHSTPLIVASPPNVRFFALDIGSDGTTCEAGNPGYRCFFERHRFRRHMLIVGSNDGFLHAFDAGLPDAETVDGELEVEYDNGSGREVFAWTPRSVLPAVRQLAEGSNHRWAVDGSPVAVDVFIDPVHDGTPTATEREWRTVVITGLREGGPAYFALDVTQPDQLDGDGIPIPTGEYVPSCLGELDQVDDVDDLADNCGPVPFPAALWEFNDTVFDTTVEPAVYDRLDEDLNGTADLGDTWAAPSLGMIRLCEGAVCDPAADPNHVVRKHVAVFGGGMDAANKTVPQRGDWLYMVDIETGKVIYKRQLEGATPAQAVAVDTDQDGFLDRIYQGTTGGLMYRVDLGLDSDGDVPSLVDLPVTTINGVVHTVPRVPLLDSDGNPLWQPKVIFDANFDDSTPTAEPRPIYQRPSVLFVAKLGLYALAFGTGDREDLWSNTDQAGRFYVFVDDSQLLAPADLPITESDLVEVQVGDADVNLDFLVDRTVGQRGWFVPMDDGERLITDPFALSGVTFFTTYQPDIQVSGGHDPRCAKTGVSRVFVVNTTNANRLLRDASGLPSRYTSVANFVTNPYSDLSQTKNPVDADDEPPDELPDDMIDVMNSLKQLFPSNCRFANYRVDIKAVSADTGVVFIAPVPVCIIEKNWKEF